MLIHGPSSKLRANGLLQPRPGNPRSSAQQIVWMPFLSSLHSVHCRFGPVTIDFRRWNLGQWKAILTLDLGTREEN